MSDAAAPNLFDESPDVYDALVDWNARLAREGPFFHGLFQQYAAGRVLDAACGTGRHAGHFHAAGLEVEGADVSAGMIDYCRRLHEPSDRLTWAVRSFDAPPPAPGAFDVAVCLGNSLALAADHAAAARAVAAMLAAVRPGGALVVQVFNVRAIAEGPVKWQVCRWTAGDEGPRVLLKGVHRCGDTGFVELADVAFRGGRVQPRFHSERLLAIGAEQLESWAGSAGGRVARLIGSYDGAAYDAERSADLIAVIEMEPGA